MLSLTEQTVAMRDMELRLFFDSLKLAREKLRMHSRAFYEKNGYRVFNNIASITNKSLGSDLSAHFHEWLDALVRDTYEKSNQYGAKDVASVEALLSDFARRQARNYIVHYDVSERTNEKDPYRNIERLFSTSVFYLPKSIVSEANFTGNSGTGSLENELQFKWVNTYYPQAGLYTTSLKLFVTGGQLVFEIISESKLYETSNIFTLRAVPEVVFKPTPASAAAIQDFNSRQKDLIKGLLEFLDTETTCHIATVSTADGEVYSKSEIEEYFGVKLHNELEFIKKHCAIDVPINEQIYKNRGRDFEHGRQPNIFSKNAERTQRLVYEFEGSDKLIIALASDRGYLTAPKPTEQIVIDQDYTLISEDLEKALLANRQKNKKPYTEKVTAGKVKVAKESKTTKKVEKAFDPETELAIQQEITNKQIIKEKEKENKMATAKKTGTSTTTETADAGETSVVTALAARAAAAKATLASDSYEALKRLTVDEVTTLIHTTIANFLVAGIDEALRETVRGQLVRSFSSPQGAAALGMLIGGTLTATEHMVPEAYAEVYAEIAREFRINAQQRGGKILLETLKPVVAELFGGLSTTLQNVAAARKEAITAKATAESIKVRPA